MSSRKWAFLSIGMTFIVLLCMAITAYAVDPFLQYRITDRNYLLKSRFVNAGVIKNHNYDTAVIGSSMIQNFNMQSFRDKLNVEPIKATISGISLPEIEELTVLLNNVGKCKNMFVCIDLHAMDSTADPESSRLPYYLYDNKKWNDYRYLLGYEAWMRFIPADIAVSLIYPPGSDMPLSISKNTDLDMLENWANDHEFGEHIVKDIYLNDKITYSKPNLDNLYERMEERVIEFLDTFEYDKEITFFFPPYSALFWHKAQTDGYYDTYMEVKQFIVKELSQRDNVKIYDFQSQPFITDLDIYRDLIHYTEDINEWMVDCFVSGECRLEGMDLNENTMRLNELVEEFQRENSDWLM